MEHISISIPKTFDKIISDLMEKRPDLNNRSSVVQQALRELYYDKKAKKITPQELEILLKYASPLKRSEIIEQVQEQMKESGATEI